MAGTMSEAFRYIAPLHVGVDVSVYDRRTRQLVDQTHCAACSGLTPPWPCLIYVMTHHSPEVLAAWWALVQEGQDRTEALVTAAREAS